MRFLLLIVLFSFPTLASRAITIKGTLVSYNDTHFKLKEGKKVWEIPLTVMEGPDRTIIEKKLGKEIEVLAPTNMVKKAK